jgi:hypothetical protein
MGRIEMMFQNEVLGRIFRPKRKESTRSWRKFVTGGS